MAYNNLPLHDRLVAKAEWVGECLIWTGAKHPRGWGIIRHRGKWVKSYRASYEVHHGPIPDGMVVMHSCDNPACINPAHLSIGTQLDNVRDMLSKGRGNKARGEAHPQSKLTDDEVAEIRRRYVPGVYGKGAHCLAKEFGMSKQGIQAILKGKSRKYVR